MSITLPYDFYGETDFFQSADKALFDGSGGSLARRWKSVILDPTFAINAVNQVIAPTGIVLALNTSNNKYDAYLPAGTNGLNIAAGILPVDVALLNTLNQASNPWAPMVIGGASVRASVCQIGTGGAITQQVRQQLAAIGIYFDDAVLPPSFAPVVDRNVTANYTAVSADSGTTFDNSGASGAVVITLPTTIEAGWFCELFCGADQTFTATAPASKLQGTSGTLSTSVSWSVSGVGRLGSTFRVEVFYNSAGTALYRVKNYPLSSTAFPTFS